MKDKVFKKIKTSILIFGAFVLIGFIFCLIEHFGFVNEMENKTFDVRQRIISNYRKPNSDIVILAIDDSSYEYILSTYGAWPVPRDVWAKLSNEIEKYNPKAIVFDLLFVQNFKAFGNTDNALIETVTKNNNIYVSMNFDFQNEEIRKAIDLPKSLETNVIGNTNLLKKSDELNFTNVRPILGGLLYGTDNIGFINVQRDMDGVTRAYLPIFVYKDKFYKHLALTVALDILGVDSKNIKLKGSDLILSDGRKIPLDNEGKVYLNWYGGGLAYKYIPLWQTDKAIKEKNTEFLKKSFENKIVYVGVTATSMMDTKTVPVSRRLPGVETHTTFVNNLIDNNFIKQTSSLIDSLISLILMALTAFVIIKSKSVLKSTIVLFTIIATYAILCTALMYYFNLWVEFVLPLVSIISTITFSYAAKYIITSRDYEHTYKLAVTDGLTDMFNHRYFQEQMNSSIEHSKRYNSTFSLIMVDIDFFKKFNDKYGHQSGDAVLRQVAQTIKRNIRATDIPCRYGGEEMSVILPNTGKKDAAFVAQKICEAVRNKEFELATGDWTHVTISLGVATMPDNSNTVQGMIEYADKCLYIAKENGRNQVISEINDNIN